MIDDVSKAWDDILRNISDIPASLVTKITKQGALDLKSWTKKVGLNYKGLSGTKAQASLFDDLNSVLGDQQVLEVVEDSQGRLLVRTDKKVYSINENSQGIHDIFEYSQPYRKTDFPLSINKLAPDFATTPYLYPATGNQKNIVKIRMQGNYPKDFEEANKLSNIPSSSLQKAPDGYVWHHLDDFDTRTGECTLQLVKENMHQLSKPHTGSAGQFNKYYGQTRYQ